MHHCVLYVVVMFSIDAESEDIVVPERNESVEVCIRRSGSTVNDYSVTLEAKMNTAGNIANGNYSVIVEPLFTPSNISE